MKGTGRWILACMLLLFPFQQCRAREKLEVMVSIPPLAYFAERIGADRIAVSVMSPPGTNPHVYEPTPGQLRALSRTELYVKVGSGLEFELAWMGKLAQINPRMLICDSSRGIGFIEMAGHDGERDRESGGHAAKDPHIWTSPDNAKIMAANIRDCLTSLDPEDKEFYAANTRELMRDLDSLRDDIRVRLAGLKNRKFFAYHPAWAYFARDFGLEEIAVEQLGKEPSPRQMGELVRRAREEGVKTIFVAPQFSMKSSKIIASEIGGTVAVVDNLMMDYPESLRRIALALCGRTK